MRTNRRRPRFLTEETREWLEAAAAAFCIAAFVALLCHIAPFAGKVGFP